MQDSVLAAVKWYFECKKVARERILGFKPPADLFELRFYSTLYFVNLLSVIEYVDEFVDTSFKSVLQSRLVLPEYPDGENNFRYTSELRNALVHRGKDIAARGSIADGLVVVHAPHEITDRNGKNTWKAFGYYLLDIIALCEAQVGPAISEFLIKHELLDAIDNEVRARSNYLLKFQIWEHHQSS